MTDFDAAVTHFFTQLRADPKAKLEACEDVREQLTIDEQLRLINAVCDMDLDALREMQPLLVQYRDVRIRELAAYEANKAMDETDEGMP